MVQMGDFFGKKRGGGGFFVVRIGTHCGFFGKKNGAAGGGGGLVKIDTSLEKDGGFFGTHHTGGVTRNSQLTSVDLGPLAMAVE